MQIVIVNLGVGNLRSVEQAVHVVAPDFDVKISGDPVDVENADKVILPGQGAVGAWFRELDARELRAPVTDAIQNKPLLGICVGMQALFGYCEEDGGVDGLGVFDGSVRHFRHFHPNNADEKLSIPQMGWNQVAQTLDHPLWQGIENNRHFYFLHSYCANLNEGAASNIVAATADYQHQYIAAVARENVFATQFHPEKSHADGLQLIRNFCHWNGVL